MIGKQCFLPSPEFTSQCCGNEGRPEKFTPARRGFGKFPRWICRLAGSLWSREGAAVHSPEKLILPRHGIPQPWWRVAFPWPASLWRVCHMSVPRSDNLVNLRAASSTCYCSRTCQLGVAVASCSVSALSGWPRYSCLGLFVLVAKPPASAHLSEVQVQQAWLSFPELSESQRKCRCSV